MAKDILKQTGDTFWFTNDRFGMFIHWGLYSLPARHEWIRNLETISIDGYQKYFDHFEPDLYNPDSWAEAAVKAGMKYFVITTKHHEGFCLWDTKYTDYKAPGTPLCGKDLLTPMVEAFRKRGIKVGFYHSLLDWHHPDYTMDRNHPMREKASNSQGDVPGNVAGSKHSNITENDNNRDMAKYRKYLYGQVEELMTQFGKIDILWFDFSFPTDKTGIGKDHNDWGSKEIIEMARGYQPEIIINDRLNIPQDIFTPEQSQPTEWHTVNGKRVTWEACHTFSGSWGYHRDEQSWKSKELCIKLLIDTVSKGGNLLLNVGPTARGEFDSRALDRLSGMGEWMSRHSRSIYGCTEASKEFKCPPDCRYTYNPKTNRLYLHFFSWPFKHVYLEFADKIEYAQLLNDASEVKVAKDDMWGIKLNKNQACLLLPDIKPAVEVPVVEIFLK